MGRYRCPGASGAGSSLGQVGAGPASRGSPGPCPLHPRLPPGSAGPSPSEAGLPLTDLGLPAADPSLCSSHHGLARRFGLGSLTCSHHLCKPSPVSSAPPPALLGSPAGPSLGLSTLDSTLWSKDSLGNTHPVSPHVQASWYSDPYTIMEPRNQSVTVCPYVCVPSPLSAMAPPT